MRKIDILLCSFLCLILLCCLSLTAQDQTSKSAAPDTIKYKNPNLPADDRVADLLSRVTLEEKIGQIVRRTARLTSST